MGENRDDLDGFWLFEGLEEEPYGILPLVNISGKGGPTSTKYVDRFVNSQTRLLYAIATINRKKRSETK
ncbi:MAG: hypothetical protein DI548_02905 [Flavobacterium johnsoniae]|nr:MAG: hypothetical protein DI548_02905 [Flavobacterium johnsoniae]